MKRPNWIAAGDVNAFFGLMLDNIAGLILTVSLLSATVGFPEEFALAYMIPGSAIGVLFGDLAFTVLARRLSKRTGRDDITAMPLGLDTPSIFGMVFFVLGPAFLHAKAEFQFSEHEAAMYAWQIGICSIVMCGLIKLIFSLGADWVRRVVPRAGLLGSLAAIALVLISFMPFLEVAHYIVAGFVALAIILTTLIARVPLPGRIPGALGALLVGLVVYYTMQLTGTLGRQPPAVPNVVWLPGGWLEAWSFSWVHVFGDALNYLPLVIPFALVTIVGGIDCVESAALAGDEYGTRGVIAIEGTATLLAGLCGGVIQTTPYIGHPAYKAMGGRAGYTLATALFIGTAGVLGYFGLLYVFIPKAIVFPILIFVGLEITSQSYHATPKRHYPAVAIACIPALAYLVMIYAGRILGGVGSSVEELFLTEKTHDLAVELQTLRMLSGGFILTSLLWGSALASLIDRNLIRAATFLSLAAALSLFGVIHSPYAGNPMISPLGDFPELMLGQTPIYVAAAYGAMALLLFAWGWWGKGKWEMMEE